MTHTAPAEPTTKRRPHVSALGFYKFTSYIDMYAEYERDSSQ